jgi:hypothetical protein
MVVSDDSEPTAPGVVHQGSDSAGRASGGDSGLDSSCRTSGSTCCVAEVSIGWVSSPRGRSRIAGV